MALMELWHSNPKVIGTYRVDQIVAMAGSGSLSDESECSKELRAYLSIVDLAVLTKYADQCLSAAFTNSGRVLQDIVNEIGRRLDYQVKDGRYQGVQGKIGFDGIWKSPEGHSLVVEVKTTDAYTIKLEKIAKYRRALLDAGNINGASSILIIVGRSDTGELEAQIRGSRFAWDIRLISVEALLKLAKLNEESNDPGTSQRIRTLLVPFEYTRLDSFIDIMFSTAADVNEAASEVALDAGEDVEVVADVAHTIDVVGINAKRTQLLAAVSKRNELDLVKKTRAMYWDPVKNSRIVCSISKPYLGSIYRYWYAYHPAWDSFLKDGQEAYVIWGALDLNFGFLMPVDQLRPLLKDLNTTVRPDGQSYWHIKILHLADGYYLQRPLSEEKMSLKPYLLPLS
jgi:hypothetical protein